MLKPCVSVVIPLYNKQSTIIRALQSIFAQDCSDIEIIIVDDGSTDGSADIVRSLSDPRIRLISQANAGPGRARNVGAQNATAPLLAFLDADDEWFPGYLQTGIAALEQFPECVAYVAGYDAGALSGRIPNRVALVVDAPQPRKPPQDASEAMLINCLHGMHSSSTIVRKSVFDHLGGFYQADRCLWGEDSFLWIKVLFSGPIYWDPFARIRYHVEDSALGFAVQTRSSARPLSEQFRSVLPSIAPECRSSFLKLAKEVAIEDAVMLSGSGFLASALRLRIQHSSFRLRGFVGDVRRFLRNRRQSVTRMRETSAFNNSGHPR